LSRNTITLSKDGKNIQVIAGWDRPLREFFLNFLPLDELSDDDTSFDDLFEVELQNFASAREIAEVLTKHGLELPPAMVRALEEDALRNVGNVMRDFAPSGEVLSSFGA